jgi:hypothetical protein
MHPLKTLTDVKNLQRSIVLLVDMAGLMANIDLHQGAREVTALRASTPMRPDAPACIRFS